MSGRLPRGDSARRLPCAAALVRGLEAPSGEEKAAATRGGLDWELNVNVSSTGSRPRAPGNQRDHMSVALREHRRERSTFFEGNYGPGRRHLGKRNGRLVNYG